MKYIIECPGRGFLSDFDLHGKQEFGYSWDPWEACIFYSVRETKKATRWMVGQRPIIKGLRVNGKRVLIFTLK